MIPAPTLSQTSAVCLSRLFIAPVCAHMLAKLLQMGSVLGTSSLVSVFTRTSYLNLPGHAVHAGRLQKRACHERPGDEWGHLQRATQMVTRNLNGTISGYRGTMLFRGVESRCAGVGSDTETTEQSTGAKYVSASVTILHSGSIDFPVNRAFFTSASP